ncbi:MAG: hypothetical protein RH949_03735 [Coleofasciculus sp. A1-SPW-01]|uniref:hypothetical protein n=1 Tax=Coleofasciculus TaxID=669368 RepID=UPI0012FB78AC|nr:hypothetical protein [Coleofasciculus chthonoplastes]
MGNFLLSQSSSTECDRASVRAHVYAPLRDCGIVIPINGMRSRRQRNYEPSAITIPISAIAGAL